MAVDYVSFFHENLTVGRVSGIIALGISLST